jgi:hypothetical protein
MLETVGVITLTLIGVVCYNQYQKKLGQVKELQDRCANLYNNLLTSEQLKTASQVELEFLKQSVLQMMNKPMMAMMNDQQMNAISQAIISYIGTIKDPKTAN